MCIDGSERIVHLLGLAGIEIESRCGCSKCRVEAVARERRKRGAVLVGLIPVLLLTETESTLLLLCSVHIDSVNFKQGVLLWLL